MYQHNNKNVIEKSDIKHSYSDAIHKGDYVDFEIVCDLACSVPPRIWNHNRLVVGEPYDCNEKGLTYWSFTRIDGDVWIFDGDVNI